MTHLSHDPKSLLRLLMPPPLAAFSNLLLDVALSGFLLSDYKGIALNKYMLAIVQVHLKALALLHPTATVT